MTATGQLIQEDRLPNVGMRAGWVGSKVCVLAKGPQVPGLAQPLTTCKASCHDR